MGRLKLKIILVATFSVLFFGFPKIAQAQVLSWIAPDKNEDGTPASVTGYRIYFKHITSDPETCDDEKCSNLCPSKGTLTHAIDLEAKDLKYDIGKDPVFAPGSMYEIRIAAVTEDAESKKIFESKKSDATVCVKMKEPIPEEPDNFEGTDEEVLAQHEQRRQELIQNKKREEESHEEIIFTGGFVPGSIGTNAGVIGNSVLAERRQGDRRIDNSSKSIPTVLGTKSSNSNYSNYKPYRSGTAAASAYLYNRRRDEVIQPTPIESSVAKGPKHLFRNDNSNVGRDHDTGISSIRPSVQSNDTVRTDSAVERKHPIDLARILKLILGILALTLGFLGLYKYTKGKRHAKKLLNNYYDAYPELKRLRRNR